MEKRDIRQWYQEIGSKGGKKGVLNPKKGFGGMTEEQIQAAWEKRRAKKEKHEDH